MQKYSFLMSVYYKEKPEYLKLSIESMINQTIKPDEIIIVKDGPLTDELDQVIYSFLDNYKDLFTIISLQKNGGLGNALNIGLKACKNELVMRMDSDDISYPDRSEKLLNYYNSNTNAVIIGGQINEFIGNIDNIISSRIVPTDYENILVFSRRRSPFNHPTVMYKRSVILKEGGYPSSGRKEDLDLFLLIISSGYRVANISDKILYYRTDNDNLKRRKKWQNCSEYIAVIRKYRKAGFCSWTDFLYVALGQFVFFISPMWLIKLLNYRFLRKKEKNNNRRQSKSSF